MSAKIIFAALALTLSTAVAQTTAPTATQPVPTTPAAVAAQPGAASAADSTQTTLKALEALKLTNEAILKKQEETLRQLAEMEKASEHLKVFSKRL